MRLTPTLVVVFTLASSLLAGCQSKELAQAEAERDAAQARAREAEARLKVREAQASDIEVVHQTTSFRTGRTTIWDTFHGPRALEECEKIRMLHPELWPKDESSPVCRRTR